MQPLKSFYVTGSQVQLQALIELAKEKGFKQRNEFIHAPRILIFFDDLIYSRSAFNVNETTYTLPKDWVRVDNRLQHYVDEDMADREGYKTKLIRKSGLKVGDHVHLLTSVKIPLSFDIERFTLVDNGMKGLSSKCKEKYKCEGTHLAVNGGPYQLPVDEVEKVKQINVPIHIAGYHPFKPEITDLGLKIGCKLFTPKEARALRWLQEFCAGEQMSISINKTGDIINIEHVDYTLSEPIAYEDMNEIVHELDKND